MKREAVFSKSPRTVGSVSHIDAESSTPTSWRPKLRWDFVAIFLLGVLFSLLAMGVFLMQRSAPKALTQQDIDGAVLHTLQTKELPSASAKAAASVQGAVVHVQSYVADPKNKDQDKESGVGTGVVIKDDGTILTFIWS